MATAANMVILDGAGVGDTTTDALGEVLRAELAAAGAEVRWFHLRELRLAHCRGDFECWVKTPGLCTAHDEARDIARAAHDADLLILLGPVTFGGYSPELKKALDRMICLAEPFFEERDGHMHHLPRYDRYPAVVALGWLPAPDPEQERLFSRLSESLAVGMYAPWYRALVVSPERAGWPAAVRSLLARPQQAPAQHAGPAGEEPGAAPLAVRELARADRSPAAPPPARAALLVGSARPRGTSTSESLGRGLLQGLEARGVATEVLHVTSLIHDGPAADACMRRLLDADLVVLASPVYFDSLPYLATRALDRLARERQRAPADGRVPRFAALINCGFPGVEENAKAMGIARAFARSAGLCWAGGLALGGGEGVHGKPVDELGLMGRNIRRALDLAAASLADGGPVPPEAIEAMARPLAPSWLYTRIARWGFKQMAREHGVSERDLHARPLDHPPR